MTVTVRRALLPLDLGSIVDGAKAFARAVDCDDVIADPESPTFARAIARVLELPGLTVVLAEEAGRTVGGIGFLIGPYVWNPDRLELHEVFWWAAPDAPPRAALMLLRAMIDAGDAAGATVRSFSALTTSPAGVDKAYRRHGLRPVQTTYIGAA